MSKILKSAMLGSVLAMPAIVRSPLMLTGFGANVLTGLLPHLFAGMDVVSRELVGMIPAVTRSASMERAAINQDVTFPIAPVMGTHDNTPAMSVPEPEDHEVGVGSVRITKSKNVNFGFVGEEELALTTGVGTLTLQAQFFAQGLRALVNEVERDLFSAAYVAASRATGTPGTTPFATDVSASAQLRKILDDNGAPLTGRYMAINTATGANLRTLYQLSKVNEGGTELTLRQGTLLDLHGFAIGESGQAVDHVKGTGAAYTTNAAGYAVGATQITLITGTGTVKAGDVVTFAGDPNKYVVVAGITAPGAITIGGPGLRIAIPAAATAMTVGNSYAVNIGMSSDAMVLAARAPAMPREGDLAVDSYIITDPRSGLSFDVRVYLGYGKVRYQVGLAWGWGVPNGKHIAILQG